MAKEKKKHSIKGDYEKIRISGHKGYGRDDDPYIYIALRDFAYGTGESASQQFTIKEAKEILSFLESAIKEANKKEKN